MNLQWKAVYDDGSSLPQYNEEGIENKYKDINRNSLARFDMVDVDKGKTLLSVYFPRITTRRLIFRRRTLLDVMSGKKVIVFLVGWQETYFTTAGVRNFTVINYIHEDGSISLDGARRNLLLVDQEK